MSKSRQMGAGMWTNISMWTRQWLIFPTLICIVQQVESKSVHPSTFLPHWPWGATAAHLSRHPRVATSARTSPRTMRKKKKRKLRQHLLWPEALRSLPAPHMKDVGFWQSRIRCKCSNAKVHNYSAHYPVARSRKVAEWMAQSTDRCLRKSRREQKDQTGDGERGGFTHCGCINWFVYVFQVTAF